MLAWVPEPQIGKDELLRVLTAALPAVLLASAEPAAQLTPPDTFPARRITSMGPWR